ncbi:MULTISPECIES: cell division protein SepF [unclassified Spiroplasma]|uniref:cell division protein SepF n=1 Tax=unclassified Spiroplasma TaxID=2637901 RepID=UPI0027E0281F|nr:cell division protein SepF [Spiroplasma sp. AdecLV25b]
MGWRKKPVVNNDTTTSINKHFKEAVQEFAPKSYQEIEPMANAMILQKPIKIDLTNTVVNDRRRIIDFLCGICYVVGFTVDKTGTNIYEFKNEN